jgi:hypothetical protein
VLHLFQVNVDNISDSVTKNKTFHHSPQGNQIIKYTYVIKGSTQTQLIENLNKIHKANSL